MSRKALLPACGFAIRACADQHLQIKQKEAIYRQMLEYRRFYEREADKTAQLEAQRRVMEASVHAVEVCWQQVLTAVRDLVGDAAPDSGRGTVDSKSLQFNFQMR